MSNTLSSLFLGEIQQRIERYQPLLEREFNVALGKVEARELRIGSWLNSVYALSDKKLHSECMEKHLRPPTGFRRCLHRAEKTVIWIPAFALLYARHWCAGFIMRWQDEPPAVLVSFVGWSAADYNDKLPKLDQWTVHELAHGVWRQIAHDGEINRGRRWRMWNEGFAHYIADVYMRDKYPLTATVDENWSAFRRKGKDMVVDVVRRHGDDVLNRIPLQWSNFDVLAIQGNERTKR